MAADWQIYFRSRVTGIVLPDNPTQRRGLIFKVRRHFDLRERGLSVILKRPAPFTQSGDTRSL